MARNRKIVTPPAWLVAGVRVDYCAIIGEPPTQRNMSLRTDPEQLDSGQWVVWLEGKAGCVAVEACLPAHGYIDGPVT